VQGEGRLPHLVDKHTTVATFDTTEVELPQR
jgi:hypothetical protein